MWVTVVLHIVCYMSVCMYEESLVSDQCTEDDIFIQPFLFALC